MNGIFRETGFQVDAQSRDAAEGQFGTMDWAEPQGIVAKIVCNAYMRLNDKKSRVQNSRPMVNSSQSGGLGV
jgi:hypothetical protein